MADVVQKRFRFEDFMIPEQADIPEQKKKCCGRCKKKKTKKEE